jgi:hypothetical protein
VETVARNDNCSFARFHPFTSFEIIENNVQLHINAREDGKVYMGRKSVWHNGEIIAICGIYKASVSVYFVSECQIIIPPTILAGQIVIEINVSLLFSGELDNDDMILCRQLKKMTSIFDEVCLCRQFLPKTFPLDSSTVYCISLL